MDVDRLMRLWNDPPADRDEAVQAFAMFYTDPVIVNGTPLALTDLAATANSMRREFAEIRRDVLSVVETPDRMVVEFRLGGRLVGAFPSKLGPVAGNGRNVGMRIIDIFTISDGLVSAVSAVNDELDLLLQLKAVKLTDDA